MRITFSSTTAARSVRTLLESYGHSTKQVGRDVLTECPTLLALPAIDRQVGLGAIDRLDLTKSATDSEPSEVGRPQDGLVLAPLTAPCFCGTSQPQA
jgi:hypothetical protein